MEQKIASIIEGIIEGINEKQYISIKSNILTYGIEYFITFDVEKENINKIINECNNYVNNMEIFDKLKIHKLITDNNIDVKKIIKNNELWASINDNRINFEYLEDDMYIEFIVSIITGKNDKINKIINLFDGNNDGYFSKELDNSYMLSYDVYIGDYHIQFMRTVYVVWNFITHMEFNYNDESAFDRFDEYSNELCGIHEELKTIINIEKDEDDEDYHNYEYDNLEFYDGKMIITSEDKKEHIFKCENMRDFMRLRETLKKLLPKDDLRII